MWRAGTSPIHRPRRAGPLPASSSSSGGGVRGCGEVGRRSHYTEVRHVVPEGWRTLLGWKPLLWALSKRVCWVCFSSGLGCAVCTPSSLPTPFATVLFLKLGLPGDSQGRWLGSENKCEEEDKERRINATENKRGRKEERISVLSPDPQVTHRWVLFSAQSMRKV